MGRRALIDRTVVLDVAAELAEDGGFAAVTMQAVAERLGVTPMALYRHVNDKADLFDGVLERLLLEIELPDESVAWQERLRVLADAARATAQRHPEVFPLLLQRPSTTPGALRIRGAICSALRDAGLPEDDVPHAERLLSTLAVGFATSEATGRFEGPDEAVEADIAFLRELLLDLVELRRQAAARA
jgi:AcrR family transcriptional regulator